MSSFSLICRECRHRFRVTCEGLLDEELRVCPDCGSRRVRQTLGGIVRNLDVAAYDGEKLINKKCA